MRSTYRKPAHEVAWQKQLRDGYLNEGSPPEASIPLKASRARRVSQSIAKSIILRYEWLGALGTASVFYGLMFGDKCAGVCCVAVNGSGTAGPTTGQKFGLPQTAVCTLSRGACVHWAPAGANSKLVSWTCRLLARDRPEARIVLAYSDSDAGEIGTIYQACGWTYIGCTKRGADAEFVSPQGRVLNSQTIGHWAKKNGMRYCEYAKLLKSKGWVSQRSNPKRIYCRVLRSDDQSLVARVSRMRVPYPKRAVSIGHDAPANQVGKGGL